VGDPTTIALNLTFFGTLGLAFLMFLGMALCMAVTLVLAGIARLLSIMVLAMVGIFPKNDADPVVHLPRSHGRQVAGAGPAAGSVAAPTTADPAPAVEEPAAESTAAPRPGVLASAKQVTAAAGSTVRAFPWKKLFSPKEWPTAAQLKTKVTEGTSTAVESQTKHHPLLLAATPEPPVLNAEWAAAVAEADAREEARIKDQESQASKESTQDAPESRHEKSDAGSR
jgi:hypothetical protein